MFVRFEIDLTKPEYVSGLHTLSGELHKIDTGRTRFLYERLAINAVLLTAIAWSFPHSMTGIFLAIVGWFGSDWLLAPRWTRSAHGVSFDPALGTIVAEFSDDGIRDEAAQRVRQWRWPAVRKVHDTPAGVVFQFVGWDMIILPNRLWTDPADRSAFLARVAQRLPGESAIVTAAPGTSALWLSQDYYRLAAAGAFIDTFLVGSLLIEAFGAELAPVFRTLGFAAAMLLYIAVSAALGYAAYRVTGAGLPKLHRHSPLAAQIVAHFFIWAFAGWFVGRMLGLW